MRLIGTALLVTTVSACGAGGIDSPYSRIESGDPNIEYRLDELGIVCESTLEVTGTFTETMPEPVDNTGCWAHGTWQVTATVKTPGCDPAIPLETQYTYDVAVDPENGTTVAYTSDPTNERINVKVTYSGDSCHGIFQHYGPNHEIVNLQPYLNPDGSLSGEGTAAAYWIDPFEGDLDDDEDL